jgi:2-isopropylmalate synthase
MKIFTFDTTLREGTLGEAVSFSVDDKLVIVLKLEERGINSNHGGCPGSNRKEREIFTPSTEVRL